MARKKRGTKKRHSRRRRIGAVSGNMTSLLGIIAGAAAGKMLANKVLPNIDSKIKNAGVAVIGAFVLPKFMKNELGKALGNGMVAAGGLGLISELIPGIGAVDETIEFPVTVGEIPDNISVISGGESVMAGDNLTVLAGMDEEDEDY